MIHRNYIKLGKDTYEVKIEDGKRMICFGGTWLSHNGFVDMLADIGAWDQLSDLIKAAFILKPDEAITATENTNRQIK
jgi:hypothetical protein